MLRQLKAQLEELKETHQGQLEELTAEQERALGELRVDQEQALGAQLVQHRAQMEEHRMETEALRKVKLTDVMCVTTGWSVRCGCWAWLTRVAHHRPTRGSSQCKVVRPRTPWRYTCMHTWPPCAGATSHVLGYSASEHCEAGWCSACHGHRVGPWIRT